ncbi:hypothetical protein OROMI_009584 [Orobanche minor]
MSEKKNQHTKTFPPIQRLLVSFFSVDQTLAPFFGSALRQLLSADPTDVHTTARGRVGCSEAYFCRATAQNGQENAAGFGRFMERFGQDRPIAFCLQYGRGNAPASRLYCRPYCNPGRASLQNGRTNAACLGHFVGRVRHSIYRAAQFFFRHFHFSTRFFHLLERFLSDFNWGFCSTTSWLEFVNYIKNQSLPTVVFSSNQVFLKVWKRDNGRRSLVNEGTREAFSPFGRSTEWKRDNGRRGLVNENATVYRSSGRISAG